MQYKDVLEIIKREVKRKGYDLIERDSVSTNSHYFKLYSGKTSLMFRISDHNTKSNIITLRIDGKKMNPEHIKNFIINRMSDLGRRHLKDVLGM